MAERSSDTHFQISQMGSFEFLQEGGERRVNDPYRLALTLHWRSFFFGLFLADLAINLFFACLYALHPGSVQNAKSLTDLFFFSAETLATVGYGVMAPADLYGHIVSMTEILTGMAFTAISTGLIFIRFTRPRPRLMFADNAVVTNFEGQPTLMIRLANGDSSPLLNASAKLMILMLNPDKTSPIQRRLIDLDLTRSELPFFPLTWTITHRIGPKSPLHGLTAQDLQTCDARVVLTFNAYDSAIQTNVHVVKDYTSQTVRFGHKFVDMISRDGTGRVRANLPALSNTEPDGLDQTSPEERENATVS
jgi:inward rectifier potassium channel